MSFQQATSSSSSSSSSPAYRTVVVGGIETQVYGLDTLTQSNSSNQLAVLFFLHGRFGSATEPRFIRWSNSFIEARAQRLGDHNTPDVKDLLVVTFDQRNHGQRTVDKRKNKGWKDDPTKAKDDESELDNPSHAVDMVSIQTGTARDVSFLIDFMEASLFPHDPRISLGIPIIGSPDTVALLSNRAKMLPRPFGPLQFDAPYIPPSLARYLDKHDPVNVDLNAWRSRKLCVLSGQDDELVNYVKGGTEKFIARLRDQDPNAIVEVFVEPGVGHAFSDEQGKRASDFLWRHGLQSTGVDHARM
ncbi:hypothetical protein OIO90_003621 [Microbotryomycetes sp. JL221]|nr:hypothetical protein OIO90_003621 [Microbotryomycetes sp. JL221]